MDGLIDLIATVTLRHKLVRHAQNKESFGRYELHPILSTMLESSASIGKAPQRAVILQRGVQFLMVFYTTCRPSTLAPGEQIWRELGQVILLVYSCSRLLIDYCRPVHQAQGCYYRSQWPHELHRRY